MLLNLAHDSFYNILLALVKFENNNSSWMNTPMSIKVYKFIKLYEI